ncbi:hypothetical protein BDY24DRAFT_385658 [Mrakia frigida]|uniref:SNG1 family protein n=1 Tax=Mrakia frigida TaxID=29902 RepID=UPI003FCBF54D
MGKVEEKTPDLSSSVYFPPSVHLISSLHRHPVGSTLLTSILCPFLPRSRLSSSSLQSDDVVENVPVGGRPQKFSHGFFDPEVAPLRKVYFKIVGMMAIVTILVMWACLSFYWGSLWAQKEHAYRLKTCVVDYDNDSLVSRAVITAIDASNAGPPPHLGWQVVSGEQYDSVEKIEALLVDEKAWAAVVIHAGAEASLLAARQIGNASYVGTSAVSAYYVQARNELAAGNFIVPGFSSVIGAALNRASAQSVGQYISSQSGNATAMSLLAQAPNTVANAYSYTLVNLRPYTDTVATAVTLVGLIYLLVLAFIQTMVHDAARSIIGPYLRTRVYVVLRLITPIVNYFIISFLFAMINLPFKVPFGAGPFTYAGGFFLWWCFCWFGMMALGLATEAMITILTPRFIAFFLVALIVVNVSETSVPIEVSGSYIYRIGYGLPFWNLSQAVRTIIFNTKNELGQNFGVLCFWVALSCCTIPLFTILMRRSEMRAHEASKPVEQQSENQQEQVV